MGLSVSEPAVNSDGNLKLWWVADKAPDEITLADLTEACDITYSLTPTGWNRTYTENNSTDNRLTRSLNFDAPGTVTEQLTIQYVFGGAQEKARPMLTRGASGTFVARYAVANEEDPTATDKFDLIPSTLGMQKKDTPAANTSLTISQTVYISDTPALDQTIPAGA